MPQDFTHFAKGNRLHGAKNISPIYSTNKIGTVKMVYESLKSSTKS